VAARWGRRWRPGTAGSHRNGAVQARTLCIFFASSIFPELHTFWPGPGEHRPYRTPPWPWYSKTGLCAESRRDCYLRAAIHAPCRAAMPVETYTLASAEGVRLGRRQSYPHHRGKLAVTGHWAPPRRRASIQGANHGPLWVTNLKTSAMKDSLGAFPQCHSGPKRRR